MEWLEGIVVPGAWGAGSYLLVLHELAASSPDQEAGVGGTTVAE